MRNLIIVLVVLGVVCSCSSHSEPAPLLLPPTISLLAPSSLEAGQTANWECTWINGTAPFTVAWDFGGGTTNPAASTTQDSAASVVVEMLATEVGVTTYTATVTVTDALGMSNSDTLSYEVTSTMNVTVSSTTDNTLEIQVDGGTAPYTIRVSEPGGLKADTTEVAADDGTAAFSFNPVDPILGGGGLCFIEVEDSLGFVYETDTHIGIDAILLNDDTLYAIPLKHEVKVGETVTILVATGQTAHSFRFLLNVGLVVPADGSHSYGAPQTLNVGAIGNEVDEPDGVWTDIFPDSGPGNYGHFISPDGWDWIFPGADPEDSLGTANRWDINLSPLGGRDVPSIKGAIFSLGFEFSQPGLKRIGFQEFNGVPRTYYSDLASSENRFWSVLMADEMGNLHPSVVGQVDNTILVVE